MEVVRDIPGPGHSAAAQGIRRFWSQLLRDPEKRVFDIRFWPEYQTSRSAPIGYSLSMNSKSPAAVQLNDKQAFAAVLKRDAAKLMARLDKGISVNTCGEIPPYYSRVPLLVAAAMEGSPECVQLLLARGANPNARAISNQMPDLPGITALVGVLRENSDPDVMEKAHRREIIHMLLKAGADPDAVHVDGELAMKWAIRRGYSGIPDDLIAAGAKAHLDPRYGILHEAARSGSVEYVRRFVAEGMSPNAVDFHDATPLFDAGREAHVEVVKHLLEAGAGADHVIRRGWSPLHAVCDHASCVGLDDQFPADMAVIKLLLQRGADINRRTPDGETPLALASVGGSAKPVMELLKAHGATL